MDSDVLPQVEAFIPTDAARNPFVLTAYVNMSLEVVRITVNVALRENTPRPKDPVSYSANVVDVSRAPTRPLATLHLTVY